MKRLLVYGLLLFSANIFAQNLPSGQVWGNTKLQGFTSNQDSSGFISLDQIKTFTNSGTGSGTVTSVAATVPTGFSISGSPITTSGTLAITNNLAAGFVSSAGVSGAFTSSSTIAGSAISGNITGSAANVTGTVAVANGGTGATTLTGYLSGNGTSAVTASSTIPTTALSGTVTNAQLTNSSFATTLTATGTDVTVGSPTSLGGTLTINIPDASATARGVATTGTQTFAGAKTFSGATTTSGGLTQGGNFVQSNTAVSSTTTLTTSSNSDIEADATSAAFTITLPTTPTVGTTFWITKKNSTTNYVTVARGGSDTIMGNTSHVIVSADSPTGFKYLSGAKWRIIQ